MTAGLEIFRTGIVDFLIEVDPVNLLIVGFLGLLMIVTGFLLLLSNDFFTGLIGRMKGLLIGAGGLLIEILGLDWNATFLLAGLDPLVGPVGLPRLIKDPPGLFIDPPGLLIKDPSGFLGINLPGLLIDPPGLIIDPPGFLNDPPGLLIDPPGLIIDSPGFLSDPPGLLIDPM